MSKRKRNPDKDEIAARKAVRKFKQADGHKAYLEKKAWDFGKVGTEQVLDTSRLMDRRKKK